MYSQSISSPVSRFNEAIRQGSTRPHQEAASGRTSESLPMARELVDHAHRKRLLQYLSSQRHGSPSTVRHCSPTPNPLSPCCPNARRHRPPIPISTHIPLTPPRGFGLLASSDLLAALDSQQPVPHQLDSFNDTSGYHPWLPAAISRGAASSRQSQELLGQDCRDWYVLRELRSVGGCRCIPGHLYKSQRGSWPPWLWSGCRRGERAQSR